MNPKDTPDLEEQKLRELLYDKLKNHGLPLGFLENPMRWQYFNDALDSCMPLIADHCHQHHNALLRELEGKLPESNTVVQPDLSKIPDNTHWIYLLGQKYITDQVKQILADARVDDKVVE